MYKSSQRGAAGELCEDLDELAVVLGGLSEAGAAGRNPRPDLRPVRLAHAIEREIIPRLVLARRAQPRSALLAPVAEPHPTLAEVEEVAKLLLAEDAALALPLVRQVMARGTSMKALYLELLAPAARRLGEWWRADLCDFTDVTVGVCRLQQMLRELGPAFYAEGEQREHGRRALLVPVPGEQHTFGLGMVAEFFRRKGWDVRSESLSSSRELVGIVHAEPFALVGLSVSSDNHLDGLAADIHAIRRKSCNRTIGVMVGGPILNERPELVARMGADATAVDACQAVVQAQNLLALLPSRC